MRKSGIGFAAMKCLNWKNMATHAGTVCSYCMLNLVFKSVLRFKMSS